jgi:hypothetical protein
VSAREPDPIRADRRREYRRRELPKDAACPECGEDDPRRLEEHEPGGRNNDPDGKVILCQLCHQTQSARQPELGVDLRANSARSVLERLISVLRGLAAMFEALTKSCMWWADRLAELVIALDKGLPQWRTLPEA